MDRLDAVYEICDKAVSRAEKRIKKAVEESIRKMKGDFDAYGIPMWTDDGHRQSKEMLLAMSRVTDLFESSMRWAVCFSSVYDEQENQE